MTITTTTDAPTPETDNWATAPLDAPRQRAGEVIEQDSDRADAEAVADAGRHRIDPDKAADAEVTAERQATDHGPSAAA